MDCLIWQCVSLGVLLWPNLSSYVHILLSNSASQPAGRRDSELGYISAMPHFPQELVDMVIDLLRDDPKALASLALTAQRWSPRSRKYLHKTLKLRHNDCIIYPAREVIRAKVLLELPGIVELAQELVLDEYYWKSASRDWDEDLDDLESNYANILANITQKCTNVRLLTIDHISWGLLPDSLHNRTWFCNAFPHITSLVIKKGVFTSPQEFLTLLNALPPLSRLTINDTGIYTAPTTSHYSKQSTALTLETKLNLSLLQELIVVNGSGYKDRPLRALENAFTEQACNIKVLDISGYWLLYDHFDGEGFCFAACVTRLLGVVSASLTTLRLHFPAHEIDTTSTFFDPDEDVLQLDRCTMLDTIEFHLDIGVHYPRKFTSSPWEVIFELFQHRFPSSLQHMKVVCIPDSQNLDLFRFGEFERLLTSCKFPLESLTFEDALGPDDEHKISRRWKSRSRRRAGGKEPYVLTFREFRDTVMAKMPGLAASGVLRVTSQMRDVYCA